MTEHTPEQTIEIQQKLKDIASRVARAIETKQPINLLSYSFSEDMERKMNTVVGLILSKYEQAEKCATVYTIVKELAINATKANVKYLFLDEEGFDKDNENSYKEGMAAFRKSMSENFLIKMGSRCKDLGRWVRLQFQYDKTGMIIEVKNNMPLTGIDEKRVREKLGKAMQYDDIAQFYLDNADESEGAGMGIALVVILMKAEGLDPALFRIFSDGTETFSRIEIPFTDDYVSLRDRS